MATIVERLKSVLTMDDSGYHRSLRRAGQGAKMFSRNLAMGAAAVSGAAMVAGVAATGALVVQSAKHAANLETARVKMGAMVKDMEKGAMLTRQLQEFNIQEAPMFELADLQAAANQLIVTGTAVEDLQDELRTLTNISAGVNEPLRDIARLVGQVRTKGQLYAEEIQQLGDRGLPVLRTMAEMYGTTTQEIRKMAEAGQISKEKFDQALKVMTTGQGLFAGMVEKVSRTVAGQFDTLRAKAALFFTEIGAPMMEPLRKGLEKANAIMSALVENGGLIGHALVNAAAGFVGMMMELPQTVGKLLLFAMERAALNWAKGMTAGVMKVAGYLGQTSLMVDQAFAESQKQAKDFLKSLWEGFSNVLGGTIDHSVQLAANTLLMGLMKGADHLLEAAQMAAAGYAAATEKVLQEGKALFAKVPGLRDLMGVEEGFQPESMGTIMERFMKADPMGIDKMQRTLQGDMDGLALEMQKNLDGLAKTWQPIVQGGAAVVDTLKSADEALLRWLTNLDQQAQTGFAAWEASMAERWKEFGAGLVADGRKAMGLDQPKQVEKPKTLMGQFFGEGSLADKQRGLFGGGFDKNDPFANSRVTGGNGGGVGFWREQQGAGAAETSKPKEMTAGEKAAAHQRKLEEMNASLVAEMKKLVAVTIQSWQEA